MTAARVAGASPRARDLLAEAASIAWVEACVEAEARATAAAVTSRPGPEAGGHAASAASAPLHVTAARDDAKTAAEPFRRTRGASTDASKST